MKRICPEKLRELVSRRAQKDRKEHNLFGVSVLVRQEGRLLLEEHYGYADLEQKRPLDGNCIFRIASMTKPITAVLTMLGVERGWFALEDPVEKHLPAFAALCRGTLNERGEVLRGEPLQEKVRIFHLLTHTSLMDYGAVYSAQRTKMTPEQDASLASALKFYSSLAMEKEPGECNCYSATLAFDVLAGILEHYSGKDYATFMHDELTAPLGMKDTVFTPSRDQWERVVQMHGKCEGVSVAEKRWEGCVFEDTPVSHPLAGAGLISTLRDYDRFAQMLLNGGIFGEKRILCEKTVKQMGKPAIPQLEGSSNRWGLGMRVVDTEEKILPVGCYGWSGAYGTHFWVDPTNNITAIYMKNSTFDGGSGAKTAANLERDVYSNT